MTARESFERKPRSFQGTVLAQRFERVLGTGRRVAARSGSEGRYAALIELYQHDQRRVQTRLKPRHNLFHDFLYGMFYDPVGGELFG